MHPFLAQLAPYLTEQRQRNRSPHTLIAYERELRELANLLPATAQPARRDFQAAFRQLSQRGLHPASLARALSAWRQYCDYLVRQGSLKTNPVQDIKAPKKPQPDSQKSRGYVPPRAVFSETQTEKPFRNCPKVSIFGQFFYLFIC